MHLSLQHPEKKNYLLYTLFVMKIILFEVMNRITSFMQMVFYQKKVNNKLVFYLIHCFWDKVYLHIIKIQNK